MKIAYGTDIGEGDHTMKFGLMIAGGLTPMKALSAATRNAADLIGAADRIGSVQPRALCRPRGNGRGGDPLADPAQFAHVDFVMKGGVIYRQDGHPTVAAVQ